MFSIGVTRSFIARHQLIGGDFGAEGQPHSHHYRLEARVEGSKLDEHGFLFDISVLEQRLDELVERLSESNLNELEALRGLNPSVERVAELCAEMIVPAVSNVPRLARLTVRVWEHETAWASCSVEL